MSQEELILKVKEAVKEDPKKNNIQSISLFGSFLHGDNSQKSDIDLLVELKGNVGLLTLMAIQNRIEDKVGQPVQLLTKDCLSRYYRDEVIKEAKKFYQNEQVWGSKQ